MSKQDLIEDVKKLVSHLKYGCGNHGCIINPPKGMGTNMSCKCSALNFSRILLVLAEQVEAMGREWK